MRSTGTPLRRTTSTSVERAPTSGRRARTRTRPSPRLRARARRSALRDRRARRQVQRVHDGDVVRAEVDRRDVERVVVHDVERARPDELVDVRERVARDVEVARRPRSARKSVAASIDGSIPVSTTLAPSMREPDAAKTSTSWPRAVSPRGEVGERAPATRRAAARRSR